jgi:hypothetical protein
MLLNTKRPGKEEDDEKRGNGITDSLYSQTSVHELNSFLKVVRKPKLFSP